jgi:hypothetical protein
MSRARPRIRQSVVAEFSKKTMTLDELGKYISPVINTRISPNRLAIVGNERQVLGEWAIAKR